MTEPLRVTIVGPSLDIIGGQSVQARRLFDHFQSTPGLRVDFLPVNPRAPGPLGALQRVKYLRTVVTSLMYGWSLARRTHRTDVVHAFSASYWSFLLAPVPAMIVARLLRRRVILNYHSGEADDHLQRHRRIALPLLRLAHCIAVPSGYLAEVFGRFGVQAVVVPNFVDPEEFPFTPRERLRPRFLCNRNFEPLYNIPCVLRAFARIQAAVPTATLVLVGDGSQRGALEQLAGELQLRGVTFTGPVVPGQMGTHYADADIYLNTPNIDNMPISLLEAFAAGVPVVSTNAGGIPWVVRHEENGLLVEPNDDAGIAQAALRLLDEPVLANRLIVAAREDVLRRYSWPVVEQEWIDLYRAPKSPAAEPQ